MTNSAAASSEIASEFAGGATPAWFASLPTPVQSYLVSPSGSNQTAPGVLGINIGGIQTSTSGAQVTSTPSIATHTSSTPPNTTPPPTPMPTPTPDHAGAIAGGVVGGLAGLALIVMALLLCRRRRRTRRRWEPESAEKAAMEPEANFVVEMEAIEPTRELTGSQPLFELEENSKPGELHADSHNTPGMTQEVELHHHAMLLKAS